MKAVGSKCMCGVCLCVCVSVAQAQAIMVQPLIIVRGHPFVVCPICGAPLDTNAPSLILIHCGFKMLVVFLHTDSSCTFGLWF